MCKELLWLYQSSAPADLTTRRTQIAEDFVMTNDLKLGIFIGSTRKDLSKARQAVIDAVLSAGHIPSGMELWAAGHIPTLDAIEKHLRICDVHIIILGCRYGSMVKDGISFTEWEYNQSKK